MIVPSTTVQLAGLSHTFITASESLYCSTCSTRFQVPSPREEVRGIVLNGRERAAWMDELFFNSACLQVPHVLRLHRDYDVTKNASIGNSTIACSTSRKTSDSKSGRGSGFAAYFFSSKILQLMPGSGGAPVDADSLPLDPAFAWRILRWKVWGAEARSATPNRLSGCLFPWGPGRGRGRKVPSLPLFRPYLLGRPTSPRKPLRSSRDT